MPLWVAITTTARPPRNSAVRYSGHGRAGWRRRTRSTPHRYKPAAITAKAVIIGANCHRVTTSARLKGGSTSSPMPPRLLLDLEQSVCARDFQQPGHERLRACEHQPAVAPLQRPGRQDQDAQAGGVQEL